MGILSSSGGGGVSLSGGGGGGGLYAGDSGLCVFTCAAILSLASLFDFDIGSESAFFATTGLGALCFTDCQYLRLVQQRGGFHGKAGFGNRDDLVKSFGWTLADLQFGRGGGRRRRKILPEEMHHQDEVLIMSHSFKNKRKSSLHGIPEKSS